MHAHTGGRKELSPNGEEVVQTSPRQTQQRVMNKLWESIPESNDLHAQKKCQQSLSNQEASVPYSLKSSSCQ